MKTRTLPTKRRPVSPGVFRRLSAVTQGRRRKQRVATTAGARDFDDGQNNARIGRALFIILMIHLLAVAMIFIHHRFLDGRSDGAVATPRPADRQVVAASESAAEADPQIVRSRLSPGETPYIVRNGDSYASIAAAHEVAEGDLRQLNDNAAIRPGLILKIPVKRVVVRATRQEPEAAAVAVPSTQGQSQPEENTTAAQPPAAVPVREQGLVEAIDTRNAPRALPVGAPAASGGSYLVQKGDSIWRIATRHGVDQQKLMDLNGIDDPRKLRAGMTLRIP